MSGVLALAVDIPNPLILAVVAVLAVAVAFFLLYNRLVRLLNLSREAWSGIDVQLKRRHNLIPNLVEIVKRYSSHEREVLTEVAATRSRTISAEGIKAKESAENALSQVLGRLFAIAEDYPDVKADDLYRKLQDELTEIEDHLQMARRYYNGAVREYNIRVESFPDNIVARLGGFAAADFFELETVTAREAPKVEVER
ncbi:MAG: LemA family protein [Planctomycetota bacterium]|jgi:LemA protein